MKPPLLSISGKRDTVGDSDLIKHTVYFAREKEIMAILELLQGNLMDGDGDLLNFTQNKYTRVIEQVLKSIAWIGESMPLYTVFWEKTQIILAWEEIAQKFHKILSWYIRLQSTDYYNEIIEHALRGFEQFLTLKEVQHLPIKGLEGIIDWKRGVKGISVQEVPPQTPIKLEGTFGKKKGVKEWYVLCDALLGKKIPK